MIVVDRVSKYYGDSAAVRDLSFTIAEGECVGFLGLNGAGKSTTLRLLSCLLLPTSGRITIRGLDAETQPHDLRKLIGYLPDEPPLYPEMTVERYLRFAGKLRQMGTRELGPRIAEVLSQTSLTHVADQPIATLSHGYKQRVGIAQAIVHRPALLILDEPIQGLDPVQIVEMRALVRSLRGQHTILLSSHILSEIERTCDRLLMLHEGRIVAQGSEEELAAGLAVRLDRDGARGAPTIAARLHVAELEVLGTEGAVREALRQLEGVEVEVLTQAGEGVLRVVARASFDARPELAACLVRAGIGLLSLKRGGSALEEMFVRLSHDEKRSGSGA
jgi:ABC-2 type transport system ATP-binding protein